MPGSREATFKTSDGCTIAYRTDDFTRPWVESETMILLHPAMGRSERFFSWMPRLVGEFRVARMDLRGHGRSPVPTGDAPLTLDRLVADVVEFLDELGVERAHFVGNSAGGYLAQRMAIEHGERVATLALYGSTPGLKNSKALSWLPQIQAKGLREFFAETIDERFPIGECDPALVEWYLDQLALNDPEYIAKFVTLMAQQEWSDELPRIQCPTLVVVPGQGSVSPQDAYAAMGGLIPKVTMKVYEGAPHTVCDFMPDRCVDDLLAFLAANVQGSPESQGSGR